MAIYPKIGLANDANPNNTQYHLSTSMGDSQPDVYVFTNTNGTQEASIIVVIKNTHPTGSLNITQMNLANNIASEGFTLDPTYSNTGTLHIGHDTLNLVKTNPSDCGNGTFTNQDATGASGFIGIGSGGISDIQGSTAIAGQFNSSGFVLPLYTSSYLIANAIPSGSYAAVLVRFKPTAQILSSAAYLQIVNNVNNYNIYFGPTVYNTITFSGMRGTSTDGGADNTDTWSAGSGIISDGGTLDLGLHPVGTDYGSTNNVIKFTDISATPGEWALYSPNNYDLIADPANFLNFDFSNAEVSMSASSADADMSLSAPNPDMGGTQISESWAESILTPDNYLSDEGNSAGDNSSIVGSIQEGQVNVSLYKNFGINTSKDFYNHSTHFDYYSNVDTWHWTVNAMQTSSDLEVGRVFWLGQICNNLYPQDTATNKYFAFIAQVGFYHKLQLRPDGIELHKELYDGDVNYLAVILNCRTQPDSSTGGYGPTSSFARGPVIEQGDGTISPFMRGKYYRLCMSFHFKNYSGNSNYNIAGHSLTDNTNKHYIMYSGWASDTHPMHYKNGTTIIKEATKTQASGGTGDVTFTDLAAGHIHTWNTMNQSLALQWYCYYDEFQESHMYTDDNSKNIRVDAGENGEQIWGIWYHDWYPGGAGNIMNGTSLGWGNIGDAMYDSNYKPRWRIAFAPRTSILKLKAIPDSGIIYYPFWNDGAANTTNYESLFTRTNRRAWIDDWTIYNTVVDDDEWYQLSEYSNNTGRDTVNTSLSNQQGNEGRWYGHGVGAIHRPTCWTGSTTRVVDTALNNNSGFAIYHKPMNYYLRNTDGTFVKSYEVDRAYYTMPTPIYNNSTTSYRSMGSFKIENSGDYPIYIQTISVETHNNQFDLNSANNRYGSSTNNVLLPEGGNPKFTPSASSNTPAWKFFLTNETGADLYSGGSAIMHTAPPTTFIQGSKTYGAQLYGISTTPAGAYNNSPHVKPSWDGSDLVPDNNNVFNVQDGTMLHVQFDYEATGNSANDQGSFYVQILIAYYVDEYQNRYEASVNSDGAQEHTSLNLGSSTNTQSRLQFSKYLVQCRVEAPADIQIVDSENDSIEDGSTIVFPPMSVD
tara:strand:+ start:1406 stop:4693 length:3288 start_codon:yes stop_codon:yes gene_type:complete